MSTPEGASGVSGASGAARASGASDASIAGDSPAGADRPPGIIRRLLRMELRIYESLGRFIIRRPSIAAGATGFRYHGPVLTVLIIFIVLSAVEIPIIDLIVHRWTPVRIAFLAVGVWGLTWMLGLLCAYLTRPHTVGPEGILVREGLELDLLVSWDDFASLRERHVSEQSIDPAGTDKPGRVFEHDGERVCAVWVGGETNLEIGFERPTRLRLPGRSPKGGEHEVTVLRFWADDPRAVLECVQDQLDAGSPSAPSGDLGGS